MTEPETMTYTESHFKSGDKTATNIRNMIFNRYALEDKAWAVADSQIHLFDIDLSEAKQLANKWWDSQGNEVPDYLASSLANLEESAFDAFKEYAVQDAGKRLVNFG